MKPPVQDGLAARWDVATSNSRRALRVTYRGSLQARPDGSLCVLEHERRHGGAAQVADGSGCEREVHGGASLRVHPGMHRVRSAGHPSLPWLAGRPPGEVLL